ncbi:hypothetical protein NUSPORA_01760 [Nucleospora cyclopteri]
MSNKIKCKKFKITIHEHAISVINYHINVLKIEPSEFEKTDHTIKQILMENKLNLYSEYKKIIY